MTVEDWGEPQAISRSACNASCSSAAKSRIRSFRAGIMQTVCQCLTGLSRPGLSRSHAKIPLAVAASVSDAISGCFLSDLQPEAKFLWHSGCRFASAGGKSSIETFLGMSSVFLRKPRISRSSGIFEGKILRHSGRLVWQLFTMRIHKSSIKNSGSVYTLSRRLQPDQLRGWSGWGPGQGVTELLFLMLLKLA